MQQIGVGHLGPSFISVTAVAGAQARILPCVIFPHEYFISASSLPPDPGPHRLLSSDQRWLLWKRRDVDQSPGIETWGGVRLRAFPRVFGPELPLLLDNKADG